MLRTLSIENIAVIKQAEINFGGHFCALTGETGAGKSILIDSLSAVLGARTSKELIRSGCDRGFVSAVFCDCSATLIKKLDELGYPIEQNDDLLISRSIASDGKNVCRIGGKPATVQILRELSSLLVNVHGQHDNQQLLDPGGHYIYLDRMGNLDELKHRYRLSYNKMKDTKRQLDAITSGAAERERKLELLEYQIKELEAAGITVGERDRLTERRNRISDSEKAASSIKEVIQALSYGNGVSQGAVNILFDASHSMSKVSKSFPELNDKAARLDDIGYELRDISETLDDMLRDMDYAPGEIDEIEDRLDVLYKLSKKYGSTEDEMLAFLDNAAAERDRLSSSEENSGKLKNELIAAEKETYALANELSEQRKKTAKVFAEKVAKETAFLNMPNVRFTVRFEGIAPGPNGCDKIEFMMSVNLGEPVKPLSKIASGGELSRIMLAIKSVLAKYDDVDTLIFDEIDTGISGRAADKVGLKLRETGALRQVICVTHLAQIAAKADDHLLIEKKESNGRTYTDVVTLTNEGRKKELARIIGGENITENALLFAEEMLKTSSENV